MSSSDSRALWWCAVAAFPAAAGADLVPVDAGWAGDPLGDTKGVPIVGPDAEVSLSLKMFGGGDSEYINADENVVVMRGDTEFTSLGANVNGDGEILAQWQEYPGDVVNTIQVIWKTSNGEDILPSDAMVGDSPASFLGWVVGESHPIPFGAWVDPESVEIVNANIGFSSNGGDSFDFFNIANTLSDPWDGTDVGSALPFVGIGVNFIVAQYQYDFVPAPGAAGLLLLGAGVVMRRRR